jgi:hypothetical protein
VDRHFVDPALRDAVALSQAHQLATGPPAGVHGLAVEEGTDLAQRRGQVPVPPSADRRLSAGGTVETQDQPHGRGLPRTVGAEETGDQAGPDREAQVVDR